MSVYLKVSCPWITRIWVGGLDRSVEISGDNWQATQNPPIFPLGQAVRLRRCSAPSLGRHGKAHLASRGRGIIGPKLVRFCSSSIAMVEGTSGEVVAKHPLMSHFLSEHRVTLSQLVGHTRTQRAGADLWDLSVAWQHR